MLHLDHHQAVVIVEALTLEGREPEDRMLPEVRKLLPDIFVEIERTDDGAARKSHHPHAGIGTLRHPVNPLTGQIDKQIAGGDEVFTTLNDDLHAAAVTIARRQERQRRAFIGRKVHATDVVQHQEIAVLVVEKLVLPELFKVQLFHSIGKNTKKNPQNKAKR